MCGSVYMTGTLDQPLRAAATWVDYGTATMSAFGTLAALMARDKFGGGQKVETALLHTALAFNNAMLIEQAVARPDREPTPSIVGRGSRTVRYLPNARRLAHGLLPSAIRCSGAGRGCSVRTSGSPTRASRTTSRAADHGELHLEARVGQWSRHAHHRRGARGSRIGEGAGRAGVFTATGARGSAYQAPPACCSRRRVPRAPAPAAARNDAPRSVGDAAPAGPPRAGPRRTHGGDSAEIGYDATMIEGLRARHVI